jgi:hypothetical protein
MDGSWDGFLGPFVEVFGGAGDPAGGFAAGSGMKPARGGVNRGFGISGWSRARS